MKWIWIYVGVAMAISGCMGAPGPKEPEVTADVLVIGGGVAGLVAAVETASLDAEVVLLEKTGQLGGAALMAREGLSAGGSHLQHDAGARYAARDFEADIMEFGQNRAIREMAHLVASESASAIRFLEDLGVDMILPDPDGKPWLHRAREGSTGVEVVEKLQDRLDGLGVRVLLNHRVTELFADDMGNIVGARVVEPGGKEFMAKARSVIIATGGFASNSDMVNRFANQWEGIGVNLRGPGSMGEGIRMSMTQGADITHMQYLRVYPLVTPDGIPLQNVVESGAILVNSEGYRFTDEMQFADLSRAIMDQPGSRVFLVGDAGVLERARANLEGVKPLIGEDLEELAGAMNVPPDELASTLREYNGSLESPDGPDSRDGYLIVQPPFFAQAVYPAVWATLGGLKVNEECQVLREGEPLPGFFAAGEVVGGVFGADERATDGLTADIVLGRVAAKSAVSAAEPAER